MIYTKLVILLIYNDLRMILMYTIVVLSGVSFQNMVIWKERTHDDKYADAKRNLVCIATLRNFGLLNFF